MSLSFAFDSLYGRLYIFNTKDGCSLQLKHTGALQQIAQLVGNKLVCIRQLQRKWTKLNGTAILNMSWFKLCPH